MTMDWSLVNELRHGFKGCNHHFLKMKYIFFHFSRLHFSYYRRNDKNFTLEDYHQDHFFFLISALWQALPKFLFSLVISNYSFETLYYIRASLDSQKRTSLDREVNSFLDVAKGTKLYTFKPVYCPLGMSFNYNKLKKIFNRWILLCFEVLWLRQQNNKLMIALLVIL